MVYHILKCAPVFAVPMRQNLFRPGGVIAFFLPLLIIISNPSSSLSQHNNEQELIRDLKSFSLEELLEIEVMSVSKHPEKLNTAPSAIQVITSDDIRISGCKTVPEALRLATNLQVAQVNASQWAISSRGFNNVLANKLLVLIDGRTVYTPLYAGVFWDAQNVLLDDIERIEVISGPGGSLWGANAVNGVINIITKNANETAGVYAELAGGTDLPGKAGVRFGGDISDDVAWRISGLGYEMNSTLLDDGSDAHDDWSALHGNMRVDWKLDESQQLTIQGGAYRNHPNPDGTQSVLATGNHIMARWNFQRSERYALQIKGYYDRTWRDFRNDFTEKLRTYDIAIQNRHLFSERHTFSWGADFRLANHEVTNLALFSFLPAKKDLILYSLFLQEEYELKPDKLRLILGTKIEHNSYTDFELSPNIRLAWTPNDLHTFWGAISKAVRTPSRIDRDFYLFLAPGVPYINGGEFESEDLVAFELGWRYQSPRRFSFALSSFYNIYDHIRSVSPGDPPFGFPVTFSNDVEGETYGLEASLTYPVSDKLYFRGGYTYLHKDLRVKEGAEDLNNATAESNDPDHQFLIQTGWNISQQFELGSVFRFVENLHTPSVDRYVGLDLRLAWKATANLGLSVTGQNLVEERHQQFIPSSPSPRLLKRSIYLKAVWRI